MIKKILCLCVSVFLCVNIVEAKDLSTYCAAPHDLSMKGTQILTNITGMTLLSQAVANSIIKNEMKKATGTRAFKVKMKSYSAKDLAEGRFKSLTISGKNLNMDGVYLSQFNASSICDFNYINATPKTITFKDNFAMKYDMLISDSDLKKTILSKDYLSFLSSLNLKTYGINLFELNDVDVKLMNNKFYFTLKMNNKIFNVNVPINLVVSTAMRVENGQIKASEVTLENLNQKVALTQITNLLNLINPLNFTVDVLGNSSSKVAIDTFNITGNKVAIDGTIFIPKNATEARK